MKLGDPDFSAETERLRAEAEQRRLLNEERSSWGPPSKPVNSKLADDVAVLQATVASLLKREPVPADPDARPASYYEVLALADESGRVAGELERRLDALAVEMEQRMGALAQEIPPATGSSPSAARLSRELRLMVQTVSTEANKNYATLRDLLTNDRQAQVAKLLELKEQRESKQYELESQILSLQRDVMDLREALRGGGAISVPARTNGSGRYS